ncbi:single-stranded-DNA-specific exonuclease RecJ [Cephaloticoccus capnophilus]|uniref:Single-stranded-DNA-specific exonuclease RecJ n=1 Tax=Cephaloticoccus capnophilus TaxID=1548208 RepID=A0A139SI57_9BACT|nr:single-stranded-DNA-specific exonuclease RecJ [Cephaloticoccus capnophilus]KXU34174.1 single-stranded-DNA-specific exonuclease RecJ [Cephaloticoccus capnophilus]
MLWTYTPPSAGQVEALTSASGGLSRVLAELLLRHRLADRAAVTQFLHPRLATLADPFVVPQLKRAAERLHRAIERREQVVVLGDYDVDGVSSTTLLVGLLRRFGLAPRFIVPLRAEDGYGLSRSAIDRALEAGRPALFVALDCGTNSHDEIAYLIGLGIDVLIVDHHRSRDDELTAVASPLPQSEGEGGPQCILVNPHIQVDAGELSESYRNFCTVGLVFKLAHGLLKLLRPEGNEIANTIQLREELDLVALGTVADLVPLLGENRILSRHGLKMIEKTARPGLRALMEVAGLPPGQAITPVDISFRLGPRINASGRLADAALSVELLLTSDSRFAETTAQQLDAFNRERQDIERQMTEEAEAMIDAHYADDQGIVLYSDKWHPGVVGIVAGRVTRKYNRPCVVLGNDGELAKGSGRSVTGVNLVDVLADCAEELEGWGGHPMAVGVGLDKQRLASFRQKFAHAVREHAGRDISDAELPIAAWISPEEIGEALMAELDTLHPFGQGNPEPIFGMRGVYLAGAPAVFKDMHFRFQLVDKTWRRLYGVAWKMADRIPPTDAPLDLALKLTWNYFRERKLLQLELVDWRLHENPTRAAGKR